MSIKNSAKYEPTEGFRDYYGNSAHYQDYISNQLYSYYLLCGYKRVKVPTLEKQSFFSSEYVGTNPWPNWHPKSLFALTAKHFNKAYESKAATEERYFLIPELTTSVCRWLASEITQGNPEFVKGRPTKVFYAQPCFRNELTSKLSDTKFREFTQIGVEYFGLSNIEVDIEVLELLYKGLVKLGFKEKQIKIRINDVRLFNYLASIHELDITKQNIIKGLLDEIASYKARRQLIQLKYTTDKLLMHLKSFLPDKKKLDMWGYFLKADYMTSKELESLYGIFPEEVLNDLNCSKAF